jgi:hypothetical protein
LRTVGTPCLDLSRHFLCSASFSPTCTLLGPRWQRERRASAAKRDCMGLEIAVRVCSSWRAHGDHDSAG